VGSGGGALESFCRIYDNKIQLTDQVLPQAIVMNAKEAWLVNTKNPPKREQFLLKSGEQNSIPKSINKKRRDFMRNGKMIGTILAFFILSGFVVSQEKNAEKIELPQMKIEQKWHIARNNLTSSSMATIAFAKSLGKTPEDFGAFYGELTASTYEPRVKSVKEFVQAINVLGQIFYSEKEDYKIEILSESEISVEGRMSIPAAYPLKYWTDPGVTVEEYIRYWGKYWTVTAEHIGMEFKQKLDGDWVYFTVSKKE
jgi:hypothetical protein